MLQSSIISPARTHTLPLPAQPTALIGRAEEVAEIVGLLTDPACRLLTLVGPGGIGKTRLALQAAVEAKPTFAAGACLVNLQPIESVSFLATAIADALNISLRGSEEPELQLLTYLSDKQLLLVLDNFEQLIGQDGTGLLSSILEICPSVKLLITSREVLNLQEEWLYQVQGLSFPPPAQTSPPEADDPKPYSAIQLFVDRALRVRRDFSLEDEYHEVVRICQLVKGLPLALELAASWVKTLNCQVIATEIQRNLDFLTTQLRNVPDRQRSIRAVFDYSWQLLSEEEQGVFRRLSVFRGGFDRVGAERVAGASLAMLSALVDKSLLSWEAEGRYQIHELLRQYAAEQLARSPTDIGQAYERHSAYYADFLQQRAEDVQGRGQREALKEISADLENIRAAWQWAVQTANVESLYKSIYPLQFYFDAQGRYLESLLAFEQARQTLDRQPASEPVSLTLAHLLVYLGWSHIRLGRLDQAQTAFARSRQIYTNLAATPPPGFGTDPLLGLGLLAHIWGDYAQASQLGETARQAHEVQADRQNLQIALYVLTNAALAQGEYEAAQRYAEQAYTLSQETENRWFMGYTLSDLGRVAQALGDYDQAQQHFQASRQIKQEFNDPEGIALALNHLGRVALLQQNYQDAEKLYRQSLALYRDIGDQGGLATTLNGLGAAACGLGQYPAAQHYFREALQITSAMQFGPLTLTILIGIAEMLGQAGQPERRIELLALVAAHPAGDFETKARAQQLLAQCQADLPPDESTAVSQQGASADLATLTSQILTLLAAPLSIERSEADEKTLSPTPLPPRTPALLDPLTPRELEVLRLIAEGMTNQQIAEQLIISVGTAKFYTSQIYSKLHVSSRTQAIARARELDLLA
ncbi:MAG: hypothetical protein DPW09_20160 [Anaerolineae bacterium]|nr:tetratricopeptide repeat protein [Anaerolineales bacterium]MCQ3975757.1 hypothetical protein [Anaerolineae bacterium]